MNRAVIGTVAVIAALLVTGCAASEPPKDSGKKPATGSVVTPEPEPTATAADTPAPDSEFGETKMSSRGNMIKQIGQLAGTGISGDASVIGSRFVVTDIVLDPKCDTGWADPPANGHYLAVHLNVETTPELAQSDYPEVWFTAHDWQAYDPDGKRLNDPVGNAWSCMSEASTLPESIGPGQSVSGYIVLDVAATTGAVALVMGPSVGWEWEY